MTDLVIDKFVDWLIVVITSARDIMYSNARCLSVCLSVSNFMWKLLNGSSRKLYHGCVYAHGILEVICLRRNFLQEFFWRILQHCDIRHFSTMWRISLESMIEFSRKFYHRCVLEQGSLRWILEVIPIPSPAPDLEQILVGGCCSLWLLLFCTLLAACWYCIILCVFDQILASSSAQHSDTVTGEEPSTPDSPLDASCDEVEEDEAEDEDESESNPQTVHGSKNKNRASPVWKYFIYRRTYALCKLCRRSLKRSRGNTSNMLGHLKRVHRKEYVAVMKEKRRRKEEVAAAAEEVRQPLLCVDAVTSYSHRIKSCSHRYAYHSKWQNVYKLSWLGWAGLSSHSR